jgi:translation initiation factor 2 beta subunit (eIF-2beta)/eIF-5
MTSFVKRLKYEAGKLPFFLGRDEVAYREAAVAFHNMVMESGDRKLIADYERLLKLECSYRQKDSAVTGEWTLEIPTWLINQMGKNDFIQKAKQYAANAYAYDRDEEKPKPLPPEENKSSEQAGVDLRKAKTISVDGFITHLPDKYLKEYKESATRTAIEQKIRKAGYNPEEIFGLLRKSYVAHHSYPGKNDFVIYFDKSPSIPAINKKGNIDAASVLMWCFADGITSSLLPYDQIPEYLPEYTISKMLQDAGYNPENICATDRYTGNTEYIRVLAEILEIPNLRAEMWKAYRGPCL